MQVGLIMIYYSSQTNEAFSINRKETNINFSQSFDYIEKINKMAEKKIIVSNAIEVYDLIKQASIDNSVKVND